MVALFTRAWIEMCVTVARVSSAYVALFTRAWIEIQAHAFHVPFSHVALFTRAWIEIFCLSLFFSSLASPSSRGRGLKYHDICRPTDNCRVALFTRAWIEMFISFFKLSQKSVALFTRAWIEIKNALVLSYHSCSRPLHEGVD